MTTQPPPQCILSLQSRSDYAHKVSINLKGIKQTPELRIFFFLKCTISPTLYSLPFNKNNVFARVGKKSLQNHFIVSDWNIPSCSILQQKAEVMRYKQTTEKPF